MLQQLQPKIWHFWRQNSNVTASAVTVYPYNVIAAAAQVVSFAAAVRH
jgi:hypothetical protein